jgi:methylmalonyl-CoA mutase
VLLAGRPRGQEAALEAAGIDSFIFAGADAPTILSRLHGALGIGP